MGAVLTPGRYLVVPALIPDLRAHHKDRRPGVVETLDLDNQPPRVAEGQSKGGETAANGAAEDAVSMPDGQRKRIERQEQGDEQGAVSSFDRPDVMSGLASMFEGLDTDCDGVLSRDEVQD